MKRKVLLQGLIIPTVACALTMPSAAMSKEFGDIVMNRTADSMAKAGVGAATFPHWFHRIRYKCKVCHDEIFVMKAGANNVNMRDMMDGKSCGVCHNGQVAWEMTYCDKCHSTEKEGVVTQGASK